MSVFKKDMVVKTKDGLTAKVLKVTDDGKLHLSEFKKGQVVDHYGLTANKYLVEQLEIEPAKAPKNAGKDNKDAEAKAKADKEAKENADAEAKAKAGDDANANDGESK